MNETLDHELNRLPVTKTMHDQVKQAARDADLPVSIWIRHAIAAKLRRQARDQGK